MLFLSLQGSFKKNAPLSVEKVVFDYDKTEFKIIKMIFFSEKDEILRTWNSSNLSTTEQGIQNNKF